METYLLMIYVTIQQENAIKHLFQQNGWPFVTTDLSYGTSPKRNLHKKNQSQIYQKIISPSLLLKSSNAAMAVSEASSTGSCNSRLLYVRERSTGTLVKSSLEDTDFTPVKQARLSHPVSVENTTQFVKEDLDIPFSSECQVIVMEAEDEDTAFEDVDPHNSNYSKEIQEAVNTLYTNATLKASPEIVGGSGEHLGEGMTNAANKETVSKILSANEQLESTVIAGATSLEHNLSGTKLNAAFLGTKLPLPGKFMALEELLDIAMSDVTPLKHIPPGHKSDVYFVVDNSRNEARRLMSVRQVFHDDCGIWDSSKGTTHRQIFIKESSGRLRYVGDKNGQYCILKSVNKNPVWQPVDPQPSKDQVVIIRRCYSKLKENPNYKRRVTTFESLPGVDKSRQTLAIYEYVGEYRPPMLPHGNCRVKKFSLQEDDGSPYKRIHPDLLEIAGLQAKTHKASEVEQQIKNMDITFSGTPTTKQIRNKKYNDSKKERLTQ
ncbi:hypothetical protein ACJMK2_006091 [Sinanodonta woodiana]|uniref:Uncharacterized protein n=1 Tax=Sinanodonta woodiana TaxID=1069815 RepID=A0ABD3VST1_SINWO